MSDIEFYEQRLAQARREGNRKLEADMLGSLGNTYPDMHKRMSCHEEALRIRTEIGDRLGAARACENLAGIHELARNDLPTAIKYMEMAAKLAPDWDIMKKDYQAQLEGMRKRLE